MLRLAFLLALVTATAASAAEPSGCDKFVWSIAKEQKLIGSAAAPVAPTGLDRDDAVGLALKLVPPAEAKLELLPERTPKNPSSFAGILRFEGANARGAYRVTLSSAAWIDVVQGGKYLKPTAFTGAVDCPNARKSVQFDIGVEPFALQLSDSPSDAIALVITPAN